MADTTTARVVDFTNVKEGGATFNKKRVPSGDYLAKIVKVQDAEVKKGDNQGQPQWLFTVTLDGIPTTKYPYYCTLVENQLWKVRNLLVAAGINVPKKRVRLDPSKVVGKTIAVTMEDDEYEGKLQSVIAAVFPPSEMEGASEPEIDDDEDDEDEEEAPPPAAKKKAAPAPEPEEDEDEDEEDEAPPPPKAKKKAAAPVEDDELDELDIDDI